MENQKAASPLRIALLNDSFPPTIDGVANVVLNYARLLTAAGDSVCVATPAYPGVEDDYPFPVLRYASIDMTDATGYRAGAPFSPELLRQLEEFHPDIIHTHCPVVSALLARMLRPRVNAPIILTWHTKFDVDIQKAVKSKVLQEASVKALIANVSAADEVWVVSEGAGENLRSLGYAGTYRVMENGVDIPRGHAAPEAVAAAKEKWGIPSDRPVLLFVGRMMWYKGLRTALEALQLAAADGMSPCFVLVGDGTDKPEIEALAARLGIADQCIFTGAIRDREELRALFGAADLFLFPSVFDTNGLVVREAAATGCASLLVAGSCAAEGVTDGVTGYLCDGTAADMARRITEICADTAAARQVGQQAMEGIYLSWQAAVVQARARYRKLLQERAAGNIPTPKAPGDRLFDGAGILLAEMGYAAGRMTAAGADLKDGLEQVREDLQENWAEAKEELRENWTEAREELRESWAGAREELQENWAEAQEEWADRIRPLREIWQQLTGQDED